MGPGAYPEGTGNTSVTNISSFLLIIVLWLFRFTLLSLDFTIFYFIARL